MLLVVVTPTSSSHLNSGRSMRRKRSQSRERHVEVMVAVDLEMKRHHGNDLEHYILTLMAIVRLSFCLTYRGVIFPGLEFPVYTVVLGK